MFGLIYVWKVNIILIKNLFFQGHKTTTMIREKLEMAFLKNILYLFQLVYYTNKSNYIQSMIED